MKRLAFSVAAAVAAFAFGACEKHSATELPEHYRHKDGHKGGEHAETGAAHGAAPEHGETHVAPDAVHKG